MTYEQARRLHNGDEVAIKENDSIMTVVEIEVHDKAVLIMLQDGNTYHHTEIR